MNKKKLQCIYKIQHKDNNNICYIGSTQNYNCRIASHKYYSKKLSTKLYKEINKEGGWENFFYEKIHEFIEPITKEDLRKHENNYIELMKPTLNTFNALTTKEKKKEQTKIRFERFKQRNPNYMREYNKKRKENKQKETK